MKILTREDCPDCTEEGFEPTGCSRCCERGWVREDWIDFEKLLIPVLKEMKDGKD